MGEQCFGVLLDVDDEVGVFDCFDCFVVCMGDDL